MGIRDMLKGAADNEGILISKEADKSTKAAKNDTTPDQEGTITVIRTEDFAETVEAAEYIEDNSKEETPKHKKPASKKTSSTDKKVSSGGKTLGRKPNSTKNIENRKQYSITMRPSTYGEAVKRAIEEDVPFAKYVERAVLEYMKNHQ